MNAVSDHAKSVYLAAFRNLLVPIVRMAMRNGLAHDELVGALRLAMAECAEDLHPGASHSVPQLSILTGIPRPHAGRIQESMSESASEELSNLNRIGRLIVGWQRDFVGPYGIPLELPLSAGEHSFPDLVRRYAGRASPDEVIEELMRIGIVEVTAQQKLRLTNRPYITGRLRPESIERMSWAIHDLAETLDHNLNPGREGPARFERRMYTHEPLSGHLLNDFRKLAKEQGQLFLEKLDSWLNDQFKEIRKRRRGAGKDAASTEAPPDAKHVGVGVYWFERDKFGA
jgi:hypothetical protein